MYNTYRFKDKDPIIDLLRTAVQTFAEVENVSWGKALKLIEKRSGVRVPTLYNWFSGSTISPRYATVAAVVGAIQVEVRIGERIREYRAQLRVVK